MSKEKFFYFLSYFPLILTILVYGFMPKEIPAHFDFEGRLDRMGPRIELFILPIFVILFSFFLSYLIKIASRQGEKHLKKTLVFSNFSLLTFNILQFIIIYTGMIGLDRFKFI